MPEVTADSPEAERLQEFARQTLLIMTEDTEWAADTLDRVSEKAGELNLMELDGAGLFIGKTPACNEEAVRRYAAERELNERAW